MGISAEIFVETVDINLKCPVCFDVFDHPKTIVPCGHTFCASCLPAESVDTCPSCRVSIQGQPPSFVLQGIIENLKIQCRNNCTSNNQEDRDNEPPPARRRRLERCPWEGKLSDWNEHTKECILSVGRCLVTGCGFVGSLQELEQHERKSMQKHYQLMQDAQKECLKKIEKEAKDNLQQLRQEMNAQTIDRFIGDFCRSWILKKPDPLFDFVVYRTTPLQKPMTQLLVGVPGPKRSPWEGGLYPMLMKWKPELHGTNKPPMCKFSKRLPHVNVYESGTISNLIFNEDETNGGWSPMFRIGDLLFAIQRHLSHPYTLCPSNGTAYNSYTNDKPGYDRNARETASKYSPDKFWEHAVNDFGLEANEWCCLDGDAKSINRNLPCDSPLFLYERPPRRRPVDPPELSEDEMINRSASSYYCECSPCLWALRYHGDDLLCVPGRPC